MTAPLHTHSVYRSTELSPGVHREICICGKVRYIDRKGRIGPWR